MHKINHWRNNMEENNRKNFLAELIESVKKSLEEEKEIALKWKFHSTPYWFLIRD